MPVRLVLLGEMGPCRHCPARLLHRPAELLVSFIMISHPHLASIRFTDHLPSLIARRRRRRGNKPMYGTGWMAPPPKYGAHQNDTQLNSNVQGQQGWGGANYGNAPPAYGQAAPHQPQYTGTTYNSNEGYYGNNPYPNTGVQSPPIAYQPDSYAYPHQK